MSTRREAIRKSARLLAAAILPETARAATGRITVPFQYAAGRGSILVRAKINGNTAVLIVDTGSSHVVVRPELLGMRPSNVTPGVGVIGDAVGAEVSLELSGQVFAKHRVSIMDLSNALGFYKERVDGLLGIGFLLQFSQASFDFKDRQVTLIF